MLAASAGMAAFIWAALLIELTPGPNMTYLALLSARRGIRVAAAAVAGVAVGLLGIGLAVAFGFGSVLTRSRWLYEGLRWAGVAYLFWLAWEAWRGDGPDVAVPLEEAAKDAFRDGVVTNLLNPKAALFYLSVLPAFADPTRAFAGQALQLIVVYVGIATLIHAAIVLAAGRVASLLMTDRFRNRAGKASAIALAGVAVWLLISTRYAA